jgi:hypothetical protein
MGFDRSIARGAPNGPQDMKKKTIAASGFSSRMMRGNAKAAEAT